ncbi:MAG: glycoside hydrolase family 2 protein [Ruminococcaceae bacterium]|nr:glycoside hydrolase family 2 protein [Oscillospiraceae bacterium]
MDRIVQNLNMAWEYREVTQDAFAPIHIPHTMCELPFNCFDEKSYQTQGVYRRVIFVPADWAGRRLRLRFEGVMTQAQVFLNNTPVGAHDGGYTPFEVDITDAVRFGGDNQLVVEVDSREIPTIPPFGGQLDYLTFSGIYRDVTLLVTAPLYVENARITSQNLLTCAPAVTAEVFLNNTTAAKTVQVQVTVSGAEGVVATGEQNLPVPLGAQSVQLPLTVSQTLNLWDTENPHLYEVQIAVLADGVLCDTYHLRTGFREAQFTERGFLLNGKPLKIFGLNRHQSYPYVGYAMPARAQRRDADILKEELCCNMVRTSHYPQSPHFLDRCDEIGLLVFEELPGWQFVGDEAWQKKALVTMEEMIRRDWNHPAIVLWGVRVNESLDFHDFYTETNRVAHALDPTRQTGGVRAIDHSEFLEDVYTANDFIFDGTNTPLRAQQQVTGLSKDVPYLVTECNGHMFPTKSFDQEERLVEHALRHAAVHDTAAQDDAVSGALGWCAFDYNTHCQFGSGDKICYHGVMDMFRLPKYAAYFYQSQCPPEKRGVLKAASVGSMGERSKSGIAPFTVFTNYDFIRIFSGERLLGEYYPARDRFPGLAHPPIIAEEGLGFLWGENWKGLRVEAWWQGRQVETVDMAASPHTARLTAVADDNTLFADGSDVTRVVFRLEDQNGNLLPFTMAVLQLSLEGNGTVIGPSLLPLRSGTVAVWVRAGEQAGSLRLRGVAADMEAVTEITMISKEGVDCV